MPCTIKLYNTIPYTYDKAVQWEVISRSGEGSKDPRNYAYRHWLAQYEIQRAKMCSPTTKNVRFYLRICWGGGRYCICNLLDIGAAISVWCARIQHTISYVGISLLVCHATATDVSSVLCFIKTDISRVILLHQDRHFSGSVKHISGRPFYRD